MWHLVPKALLAACSHQPARKAPLFLAASFSSSTQSKRTQDRLNRQPFKFAAVCSHSRSLVQASEDVAKAVTHLLGSDSPPHLLQLLVRPGPFSSQIGEAAEYVQHNLARLTGRVEEQPVLIGAALQSVSGTYATPSSGAQVKQPTLALFAAHLPGVQIQPFHVSKPSLPALPKEVWRTLMRSTLSAPPKPQPAASAAPPSAAAASGSKRPASTACLMFATPQFEELDALVQRLNGVVPGMTVVGGVSCPSAWDDHEHNLGCLYLGERAVAEGAVGALLHGDFQLDTVVTHGYKSVGPIMTVTSSHNNLVLELDGLPATNAMQRALLDVLNASDPIRTIKLGVDDSGSGHFTTRNWNLATNQRPPALVVKSPSPIPEGAVIQLQQEDYEHTQVRVAERLGAYLHGLQGGQATAQEHAQAQAQQPLAEDRFQQQQQQQQQPEQAIASPVGCLVFSCSELPFSEWELVAAAGEPIQFVGGKVEGELASQDVVKDPPKLHSYTSSIAFLRQRD